MLITKRPLISAALHLSFSTLIAYQLRAPLLMQVRAIQGVLGGVQRQAGRQAGHVLAGFLVLGKPEALLGHCRQLIKDPALRPRLAQHLNIAEHEGRCSQSQACAS